MDELRELIRKSLCYSSGGHIGIDDGDMNRLIKEIETHYKKTYHLLPKDKTKVDEMEILYPMCNLCSKTKQCNRAIKFKEKCPSGKVYFQEDGK